MLKRISNTKKSRRITLSIAILTFVGFLIWQILVPIIFVINKRDDWYYWRVSTMGYDELCAWRNSVLGVTCLLSVPFYLVLSIIMFVYYVKLRRNKEVSRKPYFFIVAFQIALIAFAVAAKTFTGFGVFWFALCGIVLVLAAIIWCSF